MTWLVSQLFSCEFDECLRDLLGIGRVMTDTTNTELCWIHATLNPATTLLRIWLAVHYPTSALNQHLAWYRHGLGGTGRCWTQVATVATSGADHDRTAARKREGHSIVCIPWTVWVVACSF